MHKLAILSTLALTGLTYRPHKCPQDYLWTIEGCIKDCKSKLFADCPDFYTLQFQPNFCGLNQDGYWSEYTYECQACSTPGVVGVIEGACKQYQKQGLPVDGEVYIREHKKQSPKPHYCHKKRPTEQNCPTINYFAVPEYDFCGVTYEGVKKQFDLSCSACKDSSIQYYYEMPCQNVGIESSQSILVDDNETPKNPQNEEKHTTDPVSQPIPEPPVLKFTHSNIIECIDDQECFKWEFCHEKKCLDRCALMKCSSGDCRKGKCVEHHLRGNQNGNAHSGV